MQVTVEMHKEAKVLHGLVGEGCSSACINTGLLATVWSLPFIAVKCYDTTLSDKKVSDVHFNTLLPVLALPLPYFCQFQIYPTMARVVGKVQTTAPVYNALAAHMGWNRIGIIRDESGTYRQMAESTAELMTKDGRQVYLRVTSATVQDNVIDVQKYNVLKNIVLELKRLVRVIYIFSFADDMRVALIIAKDEGMMNGEYAFVGSSFAPTVTKKYGYRPEVGPELYEGMLNREVWTPNGPEWDEFCAKIIDSFSDPTFDGWPKLQPGDDPSEVHIFAGKFWPLHSVPFF